MATVRLRRHISNKKFNVHPILNHLTLNVTKQQEAAKRSTVKVIFPWMLSSLASLSPSQPCSEFPLTRHKTSATHVFSCRSDWSISSITVSLHSPIISYLHKAVRMPEYILCQVGRKADRYTISITPFNLRTCRQSCQIFHLHILYPFVPFQSFGGREIYQMRAR